MEAPLLDQLLRDTANANSAAKAEAGIALKVPNLMDQDLQA
jgi:hypothetical protein